ncbi:lantibiotic dehydratase [Kitasatospora sp. NPDC088391]|uniref:lantibiotic dehydratase n=1 Tax=Kitasatospora sp. NPDC088391 TaxID=3364074 RepID=UPI0038129624
MDIENESAGHPVARFAVAGESVTRINPVPFSDFLPPAAAAAWERLGAARGAVLESAATAADALHELARLEPARAGEHVRLRRRVRGKPFTPLAEAPAGPAAVGGWHRAARDYQWLLDDLADGQDALREAERAGLAEVCGREEFAASLALVSADLDRARDRFLRHRGGWDRQDRKSEHQLFSYAYRAMLRTSPRSQFTGVALRPVGPGPVGYDLDGPVVRPGLELSRSVEVQRGSYVSIAESALAAELRRTGRPPRHVRLAPLAAAGPAEVAFLSFTAAGRRRVTVRRQPPLTAVVRLVRFDVPGRVELAGRLAVELGCSAADAERVVRSCLEIGLLLPALPVPDAEERFLPELAAAIEAEGASLAEGEGNARGGAGARVAREVRAVAGLVDRLAVEGAAARPGLLAELRSRHAGLQVHAPLPLQVYEDTVVRTDAPVPVAPERLAELARLLGFLAVFDLKADMRLGLRAAVRRRGGEVRLADHAEALAEEAPAAAVAAGQGRSVGDPLVDAGFGRLWSVRGRILGEVADLLAAVPPGGVLDLPDAAVRAWSELVAPLLPDGPASFGAMLQPAGGLLVCNAVFAGFGTHLARFLGPDARAGGAALERTSARLRAVLGDRYAEDRCAHGLNTGVHPQLLDRAFAPADWGRLVLADTGAGGGLRLGTPEGRTPFVLTSTRWDLLPAPTRIALWLQGGGEVSGGLDRLYRERLHRERAGAEEVVAVPRIGYGGVVLQRARWYLPSLAELLPAGEERERLHRLLGFADRWGLPRRTFGKSVPPWQQVGRSALPDWTAGPAAVRGKPRYLDLASPSSLAALARSAADLDRTVLEECLPLPVPGRRTAEYLYEFDRIG